MQKAAAAWETFYQWAFVFVIYPTLVMIVVIFGTTVLVLGMLWGGDITTYIAGVSNENPMLDLIPLWWLAAVLMAAVWIISLPWFGGLLWRWACGPSGLLPPGLRLPLPPPEG